MGISPPTGIWHTLASQIQLHCDRPWTTHHPPPLPHPPTPVMLQTLQLVQRLSWNFFRIPSKGEWLPKSPLLGISTLGRMALYGKLMHRSERLTRPHLNHVMPHTYLCNNQIMHTFGTTCTHLNSICWAKLSGETWHRHLILPEHMTTFRAHNGVRGTPCSIHRNNLWT